jgi:two-component system, sensor histidine kinase
MLSGIRARIFIAVLLPLGLAVGAVGGLLLVRHARQVETHHMESAILLARQTAMLSEMPLTTSSRTGARAIVDVVERSADLVGISLVDRAGVTLEGRGNIGANSLRLLEAAPLNPMVERDEQLIYVVHPVMLSATQGTEKVGEIKPLSQKVGYVAMSFSRTSEKKAISQLLWSGLAVLGGALAMSFAIASWLAHSLVRPIKALSIALARVTKNDFDARVADKVGGEMGRLVADFNQMAAALSRSRQALEGQIQRATETLARRTEDAEAASRAKSQYLAAASHDLRQPAHALSLYLAAAKRIAARLPTEESTQLQRVLHGMESSAHSQESLLNSILDISRIDAGVLQSKPEAFLIDPVFNRVVSEHRSSARTGVLHLYYRPTKLGAFADPVLFARICQNLVANALKFSTRGSILLAARARGDKVLIQVWDQGAGIAPEHIDRIFGEFYQVSQPTGAHARGMGLGLSIVNRLCRLQGGSISVASKIGKGTVFSVLLPRTWSPNHFERIPSSVSMRAPAGAMALVIDDEAMVREATAALLSEAGYQVVTAGSLSELDVQLSEKPLTHVTVAFVDFRLADGYVGIDVARVLQQRFSIRLKIVMVTGDTSTERLQALHESGYAILHKPVNAAQMLAAAMA